MSVGKFVVGKYAFGKFVCRKICRRKNCVGKIAVGKIVSENSPSENLPSEKPPRPDITMQNQNSIYSFRATPPWTSHTFRLWTLVSQVRTQWHSENLPATVFLGITQKIKIRKT